jgi:hypothetical protein
MKMKSLMIAAALVLIPVSAMAATTIVESCWPCCAE